MSEQSGISNVEYARQLQEKFELYLLGLIFTLLALAIQTAKFGLSDWADMLEISGWLCLLISGLFGLSRMEWLPVLFKIDSHLQSTEAELRQLKHAETHGVQLYLGNDQDQPVETATLVLDRTNNVALFEAKSKVLGRRTRIKYEVHKWSFVLALLLLMLARAFLPIEALAKKHLLPGFIEQANTANEFKG